MATQVINNYPIQDLSMFASTINRFGGLSKISRYAVRINPIPVLNSLFTDSQGILRDMVFLCEAAEFPGRTLVTSDVRYNGPVQKFPFQTSYNEVNLTFICRDGFFEKDVVDSWMQVINPINTYNFEYKDSYATSIDIFQFSEVGQIVPGTSVSAEQAAEGLSAKPILKPIYNVTLEKAYPINIAPMALNWVDDQYHRLQITFCYTRHFRNGDLFRASSQGILGVLPSRLTPNL